MFVYHKTKLKRKYHLGNLKSTLCKLQNGTKSFNPKKYQLSESAPLDREFCEICAHLKDRITLPIKGKYTSKLKTKNIYYTEEWKKIRYEVLCEHGAICQICGASPKDGVVMNVDHIYPLRTHPHLSLVKSNLRVLCSSCNWGKGGSNPEEFENFIEEFMIPWDRFDKF